MIGPEKALLEALRASAEVYRQRAGSMYARTGTEDDDDDILGAGKTHSTGDGSFIETWEQRKARRAREAEAAKAAQYPNPKHVPQDFTTGLITREAAIAKGLSRYFTGERCSHGHLCERIVSTRTCVECHRLHQLSDKTHRSRDARRLAKERGDTRYFSEKKCPKGHVAMRLTSTGQCVVCHNISVTKQRRKAKGRVIQ